MDIVCTHLAFVEVRRATSRERREEYDRPIVRCIPCIIRWERRVPEQTEEGGIGEAGCSTAVSFTQQLPAMHTYPTV